MFDLLGKASNTATWSILCHWHEKHQTTSYAESVILTWRRYATHKKLKQIQWICYVLHLIIDPLYWTPTATRSCPPSIKLIHSCWRWSPWNYVCLLANAGISIMDKWVNYEQDDMTYLHIIDCITGIIFQAISCKIREHVQALQR